MALIRYLIVITAVSMLAACGEHYSDGDRVGVVTKIAHKGLIWKSWEGCLNVGSLRQMVDSDGNASLVPSAMLFTVQDEAVLASIKAAIASGARVKLTYKQWFAKPLDIDSRYVVIAVENIETK